MKLNFLLIKMDLNLDTTNGYNNDIHKSKIIKHKPNNLATMNTVNTNINIILNREENHLNLCDSYLEIEFVVSDYTGGVFLMMLIQTLEIYHGVCIVLILVMTIELLYKKGLSKKNNVYFSYYERKTFYESVPNATNFLFDLGMGSGIERPQYKKVGFENNNVKEQTHDASTFDMMNVTECYCKIGSDFYPEGRMNIYYGTNNYNEAFKQIVSFKKDYNGLPYNLKPYINHRTFKSNYRIYEFDTGYQIDHIGPQPTQVKFKFSAANANVICHVLVLTRKVISVNSDGNKMVYIIS